MSILTDAAQAMQTVLTTGAEQAARDSGFSRRKSPLSGATFTQALVFGCIAQPQPTLEDFAHAAAALGHPVTVQALDQRFTPQAAACLQEVLAHAVTQVVASEPLALPLLNRFTGVYVLDSTGITLPSALKELWPGCGGRTPETVPAALKFQFRCELRSGQFSGPLPTPGRSSDQGSELQLEQLPSGSLRIADLGFFELARFQEIQDDQAFWLSRWLRGTAVFTPQGERLGVVAFLAQQTGTVLDLPVLLGAKPRMACRLIAVRVPPAVAKLRRQRLRKKAQKTQTKVNQEQWQLCAWTIVVTNLPQALLRVAEALVLLRIRWQVELVFKLWKSEGHLDESRSEAPWRVLSELWAKMLAQVVQHWVLVTACWSRADRSLRKAAKAVQKHGLSLARALRCGVEALCAELAEIVVCLSKSARITKRKKNPSAFQLLQDPALLEDSLT